MEDGNMLVSHMHHNKHGKHLTNDQQANEDLARLSRELCQPIRLRVSYEVTFESAEPHQQNCFTQTSDEPESG